MIQVQAKSQQGARTIESESAPIAELCNLSKSYSRGRVKALDGVNLSIEEGEIFGLIGPNGSGKTTMIGCLLGLLRPDSGSVLIKGKSPEYFSVHQLIGYMPERPDFEHWMSGRQFLEYHHELAGKDPRTRKADIEEALEFVELDRGARERRLKTYSRGMLQRLNLAQLMLGKARLLLMDEPTLGLDPNGVAVVRRFIARAREEKVTAIINSHQLDEIERLCDRVAFIKHGKIRSIEKLKAEDFCDYILCVRFSANGKSDAEYQAKLPEIAAASNSQFQELKERNARFLVKDGKGAGQLIKDLVMSGILVEEAVPERSRLEQLFLNGGESDVG
ncbi:MAG: ABC transporter ATP-binding protein [Candidatus Obscuribacterales bacterium]|nr:ABC transporter ATP-binding protein [Candidatus Obscuribacterales bacterium]